VANFTAQDYQAAQNASDATGVPAELLLAVMNRETGGNTASPDTATSSTGARGLFQILPSTAAAPGFGVAPLDPAALTDPNSNAMFAAQYLAGLYHAGGNSWDVAVQRYSGNSYNLAQLETADPALGGALSGFGGSGIDAATLEGMQTPAEAAATNANNPLGSIMNSGGAATGSSGRFSWLWSYFEEAAIVGIGVVLVVLALIWLMSESKTVQAVIRKSGGFTPGEALL
jgi:membrane-bound lytic murein transglycosylase B